MEYVLQARDIKKVYGQYKALNGLTMNVPKGSIYGFVGKNGSGKTTLIRLVCGLQRPTDGELSIYGIGYNDRSIAKARRRLGAVIETPSIYMGMTAYENLKEQYRILGMPSFDGIDELLNLVGLEKTGKKTAKNFSLGMRQRLGIAIALAGHPDFLILDEPVNGLDPQGIIEIRELILKLNREKGITVLISSHILDELAKVATHFGFIDRGKIVKEISASALENECRKCVEIVVTDINTLSRILDEDGTEYAVLSDTQAKIYGEVDITALTVKLYKSNCNVRSLKERNEDLETYYINLVGGDRDEQTICR